jgi:hypothetical protein
MKKRGREFNHLVPFSLSGRGVRDEGKLFVD